MPAEYWFDCVLTATYLINKLPTKVLSWKSLYELLFSKPSTFDHLKIFGCLYFAANLQPHKDKFGDRGIKCVFLGYPIRQKVYKLMDLHKKKLFVSRDNTHTPCSGHNTFPPSNSILPSSSPIATSLVSSIPPNSDNFYSIPSQIWFHLMKMFLLEEVLECIINLHG